MSEDQVNYTTEAEEAMEMLGKGYETPSRQITTEVSGFIPVFEIVMHQYKDHMTALVFGRMWQYCGMEDGVCRASLERIGKDLQISRATVIRHADKLVADGYLIDTTPDRRNRPHAYKDAGKVVMKSQVLGVAEKNTGVSQKNRGVAQSNLIKQDIKQEIKEKELKPTPKAKPETPPEVKLFREVTERYPNKINYSDVVIIIQGVSKRLGRDCSAEDLRPFYAAWCAKGFKPVNLAWLSWAQSGVIPPSPQKPEISMPKGFEAGRLFLERHGANNG